MTKSKAAMVEIAQMIGLCLMICHLLPVAAIVNIWYFVNTDVPSQRGWAILRNNFTTLQVKQILVAATLETWFILKVPRNVAPKFNHVVLTVRNIEWEGREEIGSTMGNHIYLPAGYIQHLWDNERDAMKGKLRLLIYHHITHVWQWTGSCCTHDAVKRGVVEGIAAFVPTMAPGAVLFGNCATGRWTPRSNPHWYDGWCQTALFFVFCSKQKMDFVAELNAKMKDMNLYHDGFFLELLGNTPDKLWEAYLRQSSSSLALAAS